jgi:hypothetical protein
MKQSTLTLTAGKLLVLPCLALILLQTSASTGRGAEPLAPRFSERQFREKLRSVERSQDAAEHARLVTSLLREGRFSSLQVKAMAKILSQEEARYDFALAAYPRTIDPDNFYEVYDAFTSFSKVLRLHDQIQLLRSANAPQATRAALQPVTEEEMASIVKAIRAEGLDDTKKALARQILTGSRRFLSRQITEVLKAFHFEDTRLEIAKLAFDTVLDPDNYFLVNQAFNLPSTKESLSKYLESRRTDPARPPGR